MKNKVIKSPIFVVVAILALVFAIGVTFFSISSSFESLSYDIEKDSTEVLLASSELSVNSLTSIPVKYYPQEKDACINLYDRSAKSDLEKRQFEWFECGYYNDAFEQKLVQPTLNEKSLPIATNSGSALPNRGITIDNFSRWFNESNSLSDTIALQYRTNSKTFSYESENFYPIDSQLFTMNLEIPFTSLLSGSETFSITADDDTWVFINDKLILDLGGIHGGMDAVFSIRDNGDVYFSVNHGPEQYSGITLSEGQSAKTHIFHANRNSSESIFKIAFSDMYLNIFDTAIAYNENDPSYVPPLGETSIFEPNYGKSILTSIIAQFFILGVLLILTPVIVGFAIRRRQK